MKNVRSLAIAGLLLTAPAIMHAGHSKENEENAHEHTKKNNNGITKNDKKSARLAPQAPALTHATAQLTISLHTTPERQQPHRQCPGAPSRVQGFIPNRGTRVRQAARVLFPDTHSIDNVLERALESITGALSNNQLNDVINNALQHVQPQNNAQNNVQNNAPLDGTGKGN